jgi:putative salt-induced outer membrane protein
MAKYCTLPARCVAGALILASGPAMAEEEAPHGLSGELSAGFVSASGNSETRTMNFRARMLFESASFKHSLQGKTLQTRDQGDTTVERYSAGYKLDFNFTEQDFAFFAADFEKDLFGGIRRRTSETVGYGRRLLNSERHEWNVELGAGARQLKFQEPDGSSESEFVGSLSTDYAWQITETSRFVQTVAVQAGSSNTSVDSETELQLSIIGNLFASLSYTAQYNSDVAPDTENTDTYTAVNLNYGFGS